MCDATRGLGRSDAGRNGGEKAAERTDCADPGRRRALVALSAACALPWLGTPTPLAAATRDALGIDASSADGGLTPASIDDPLFSVKATMAIASTILAAASLVSPVAAAVGVFLGFVNAMVSLFWPASGPSADDIWSLIRDRVQHLVDSAISDLEYAALQNAITGLQENLFDYLSLQRIHLQLQSAQSLADLRQKYIAVDAYFIGIRPQFLPQGRESRFLPLFALFANLHHTLLQDMALNGKHYGVEPGMVAGDVAKLNQTVRINCVAFDRYWNVVRNRFDHGLAQLGSSSHSIRGEKISAPSGNKTYIEGEMYDIVKAARNTYAQLVVLAKDFRDLWPYMGGLQQGPATLTRELWLGPYGRPDALQLSGDYTLIARFNNGEAAPGSGLWERSSGFEASRAPAQESPLVPLSDVSFQLLNFVRAQGDVWRFPVEPVMARNPGASMPHGPITKVKIDRGRYISRGIAGSAASIPAAGDLIAQVHFTHADGTVVSHGGQATGPDGDGREMKSYTSETLDVPADHVLSGMHVNTRVTNLYNHVGANGARTIGSMMFGFRLTDPYLTPPALLLVHLAATHPLDLGIDELVSVDAAFAQASGRTPGGAALRAALEAELAGAGFADRRAAFLSRLASRAGR